MTSPSRSGTGAGAILDVTRGPVLMVTPRWSRDGGVATHVIASAAALARAGVPVHVVAVRAEAEVDVPGVTVHTRADMRDSGIAPSERFSDVEALQPAVVHFHQFEDPDALGFLRERAPVVVSVHGYSGCTSGVHYFRPGQECTRPHGRGCVPNLILRGCAHTRNPRWLPASYRSVTRGVRALRDADGVISYSHAIDRHLDDNGLKRRAIVPLLTTIAAQRATGHEARRRVVFAGRVVAPKGVGVLIRAARSVDAEFVICGEGWQLDAMRRLAHRLGVAPRIRFAGWLDPDTLAREIAEASVVAMPSLWPEPFGVIGLEAFAAGRPVVASATGGVGEWLEHGVNGLAVSPGDVSALADALGSLLADPARQSALGATGRAMVAERYSPERHVAELLDAYRAARARWES